MEEQHNTLPPPESSIASPVEVMPTPPNHENKMALQSSEQASQMVEMTGVSSSPISSPVIDPQANTPMHTPTHQATPTVAASTAALAADDADLIEKEWVDRAKAIVAHTSHDPRQQNHEISKIKADYIKKRYNKDIKIQEA